MEAAVYIYGTNKDEKILLELDEIIEIIGKAQCEDGYLHTHIQINGIEHFSNRKYQILIGEMTRAGMNQPGKHSMALTELDNPPLDWVSMAKGFGVSGECVDTCEGLADAMKRGIATPGHVVI